MSTANQNTPDAMTVRDQFAIAAMSGLLAHHGQQFKHAGESSLAQQAYRIADAMIVERTVSPAVTIHEAPTPDGQSHLEPLGAICFEPAKNSFGGNSYTDRAGVAYGDGEVGSESYSMGPEHRIGETLRSLLEPQPQNTNQRREPAVAHTTHTESLRPAAE